PRHTRQGHSDPSGGAVMTKMFSNDPRLAETEMKRMMIELLRRNMLSPTLAEILANELELYWFPTKELKQKHRDHRHALKPSFSERLTDAIAAEKNVTKAEALGELTDNREALERSIERGRALQRKLSGQKLPDKK